jgi:hypothetical protein
MGEGDVLADSPFSLPRCFFLIRSAMFGPLSLWERTRVRALPLLCRCLSSSRLRSRLSPLLATLSYLFVLEPSGCDCRGTVGVGEPVAGMFVGMGAATVGAPRVTLAPSGRTLSCKFPIATGGLS